MCRNPRGKQSRAGMRPLQIMENTDSSLLRSYQLPDGAGDHPGPGGRGITRHDHKWRERGKIGEGRLRAPMLAGEGRPRAPVVTIMGTRYQRPECH